MKTRRLRSAHRWLSSVGWRCWLQSVSTTSTTSFYLIRQWNACPAPSSTQLHCKFFLQARMAAVPDAMGKSRARLHHRRRPKVGRVTRIGSRARALTPGKRRSRVRALVARKMEYDRALPRRPNCLVLKICLSPPSYCFPLSIHLSLGTVLSVVWNHESPFFFPKGPGRPGRRHHPLAL